MNAPQGSPGYTGMLRLIGFAFDKRYKGGIEGHLDVREDHVNRAGTVHGGVYATMLDAVCSGAGMYCPHPGRMRVAVTLSLTVNYAGACSAGRIFAKGWVTKQGKSVYYSAGEIRDEDDNLLAHAVGTFKYVMNSGGPEGIPNPRENG